MHRTLVAQAVAKAQIGTAAVPLEAQQIEEIVVTATRRAEAVMGVPLAITALYAQYELRPARPQTIGLRLSYEF